MASPKNPDQTPLVPDANPEIPLEELEERLEMQKLPVVDPALVCYADLCPGFCTTHCVAGYTGCTDLCLCDGSKCALECGTLCTVDSCVLDF